MTTRTPSETTNLDRYGHPAIPWSRPRDLLDQGALDKSTLVVLGTCRPNCAPHAAGIGAAWSEGDLYFTSSPAARKARNLAANPACTVSVHLPGIDLVLEGEALRATDKATLDRVVKIFNAGGWPAEVDGDAFTAPYSAPSAGPPPWYLFRFTVHTAFGVATEEPHGGTRWRFR